MGETKSGSRSVETAQLRECEALAGYVRITKGAPMAMVGPFTEPLFVIPCEAAQFSVEVDQHTRRNIKLPPFSLLFLPRGTTRLGFSGDAEVIIVTLDGTNAQDELMAPSDHIEERRDQEIFSTARMLRRHMLSNRKPSVDYVESCIQLLSFQVAQHIAQEATRRQRSPLEAHEWAEVLKFIDDRLDQSISVTELAMELGLSPSQCSRAFKATIGYPPRDYIRERKLHRARELLATSSEVLADVALASGFCSQAHMTATFSRMLGVTPAQYRKDTCSAADVALA